MKLYYKDINWQIVAPNTEALIKEIISKETNKKYLTLKQCSKILYTFNQAWVVWNDHNYNTFVGNLSESTRNFYMTRIASQQGVSLRMERNNLITIKNDFEYIVKLFASIVPSMILDHKSRLYFE
jgi:hypothetical protein